MTKTSADSAGLHMTVKDHVGWITIDNPSRLNALTADMWARLPGLIHDAENDADVRVVVLRGSGDQAFSAGADISEFKTLRSGEAADRYNQLNDAAFVALRDCQKPTVAMIHGFCLGGGLALAVSCDLRFCDDTARFAIPAARIGVGYHPRWVRAVLAVIAVPHAKELLFTGERFDANWAARVGLVNDVASRVDLEARIQACLERICDNAPLTIRAAKRAIDALSGDPAGADHEGLAQLVADCFASEDYVEGQRAFLEKRKPEFKGQ